MIHVKNIIQRDLVTSVEKEQFRKLCNLLIWSSSLQIFGRWPTSSIAKRYIPIQSSGGEFDDLSNSPATIYRREF